jgi:hypothetical protein
MSPDTSVRHLAAEDVTDPKNMGNRNPDKQVTEIYMFFSKSSR